MTGQMEDIRDLEPGVPARVPAGTRVYAIGDVHGLDDLLGKLLAEIEADILRSAPQRVVVVFLGDLIDRGPDSAAVVERVASGPPSSGPLAGAEWVTLRGNHEDFMLRFLENLSVGPAWCMNGGVETVRSYAGEIPDGDEADMMALQWLLHRSLPPAHLRFLSRLPVQHVEGDYLFVHAGIKPGVPWHAQDPSDLIWIRDAFLHSRAWFGKVVVHGHTISPVPEVRPNRIGIDTGAYRTGRLTALVLEEADRRFLVVDA